MIKKKENDGTLVSHVYDLNVFELIEKMKAYFIENSKPDELESRLELLQESLESVISKYKDYDSSESFNMMRKHLLLPSSDYQFHVFLAYKLLTCDPYIIQAILSYHAVLFQGNDYASKGNFVGLVEFYVYDLVKSMGRNNEVLRLDKISTWLENNRRFELQKANTAKRVRFDEEFGNILSDKLKSYTIDDTASRLFESLFEEKFTGNKVIFKIDALELCLLLKDCRKHKRLTVKSNSVFRDWIIERFNVLGNKKEILNPKTVLIYLNRDIVVSVKKSRIYDILFPVSKI